MKHIIFSNGWSSMLSTVLFFLSACFVHVQAADPTGAGTLKVISYNIWNGFEWGKDEERKQNFIKWMQSQKPGVVALQELCGYTREKLLEDAKKWGHSYAEILKTSGYPVGLTSSKPIHVVERVLEDMHHGALHCKTWGVDFLVVHFSPFSFQKRRQESTIILKKLAGIEKTQDQFMVLGDFNAVSPFDADLYKNNPGLLDAKKQSEKQHDHVRNLFHGQLEYGVLSSFLGFPLIDVVQKFTSGWDQRVSYPTQVFEKKKGEERSKNSTRIDYILTSAILGKKCIHARVQNNAEAFYLSDHYPVIAEFRR